MTRSIFDPFGPDTERSGSTHLGEYASNRSHMPDSVTDGEVSEEEVRDADLAAIADAADAVDGAKADAAAPAATAEAATGDSLGASIAAGAVPTGSAQSPDSAHLPENDPRNPTR